MESVKDDASVDFYPRSYQLELYECARKKNSILVLGTGSGKTFISILLIKELADKIRGSLSEGKKRTVFVVNTVPLVYQQAAAIEQHTPYKVGKYEGSMGVDYWTDEHWKEELENHEVLVFVAQIFLDLILHARLPLSKVNLLIIDECHHATGNHPMREIMREYERLKQYSPESLPRVLGLTACVVHRKCKKNKVKTYMADLERAMDCALVTSDDPATVLKFTTGPKEVVVCYVLDTILSEYQEIVRAQLIGLQGDITSGEDLTVKAKKQVEKKIKNIIHIMDTLGDWCVARAIKYEIENLEEAGEMEEDQKVQEVLMLLKERLKDIYESCALKEKNMTNPLENVSFKVKRLIEVFSKCNEEVFGLIFVERRNTAKILYDLLLEVAKQNQEFSFIRPSYVVGCNTRPGADIRLADLEMRKQKETLEKFRKGESNFLISTSVLEEGVDIRKCNLVIRFDMPQNYRAYVQSRGRARAKPSVYLLMVHEPTLKENIECIEVYKEIGKSLQDLCHDRDLPKPEDTRKHFAEDEYIKPYQPYGPRGPKITANSSIPLINMYCAKLPADKFTNSAPLVEVQKRGLKYVVGIGLPIMSPLKDMIYGTEFDNPELAKKAAALELCIKLHEMGELNDQLRPKDYSDETLLEGLVELPPEKDPKGAPETGTRKRKRVYSKDVCKPFSDSHEAIYFLYAVDFKPCNDTETSVTIDSSTCDTRIGFICKDGLVLSPFHLFFSKWGGVLVNVQKVGPLMDLDYNLLKQIKKFHRLVFENLLELKPNLMCFDPKESKHDVYIVPLDSSGIINLDVLSEIYSHHTLKPSIMTTFEKVHSSVERSAFEDALIYPLYGTPSDQMYYVSQILDDLNPLSSFPDRRNCTYDQFFWERYNIKIQNMNQPLLEAKHIPKDLNYLKKIPKTSKANKSKCVPRFVPELCGIMPLKASLWWQIMLIPSVLHRLNSLNLMHTFINETEVLPLLPVNEEMLDCSWTRKFIQGMEASKGNKLFTFLKHKCHSIHPFKMLLAFTAKEANEHQDFNLERLELLGDSFLKFSTGEALFTKHDIAQEGHLSLFRGKLVSNKTLYLLAREKGLVGKIAAKVFSPKTNGFLPGFCVIPWIEKIILKHDLPSRIYSEFPENVTDKESLEKELLKIPRDTGGTSYNPWTEHEVADKNIADCVEAIIGAYLLVCGREAAVSFMDWIGIGVYQGNSLLQHEDFVKTACVRPEGIHNLEKLYKKACLDRLEKKIGYTFQDKSFIVQAVTHTSYCQNQVTDCYQRLEFLGDAVLDFLVTSHIFLRYTDYTPGQLSDLRSYFVKNETLARCAIHLNLQQHLLHMAPMLETAFTKLLAIMREDPMSEELNTEDDVEDCEEVELPKALGDIVESLIGAVYLDSRRSLTETWKVIENILGNLLYTSFEKIHLNPVRQLLEKLPERVSFEKIDDPKVPTYKVVVVGFGTFTASAKNLRLAKKKAAMYALKGIQNREAENAIAQLPQPPHI